MTVYVLMRWTDGFGHDTEVIGIYETLEKIYELNSKEFLKKCRFKEIDMNKLVYLDYYEGLEFGKKYKRKRGQKRK